MAAQEQPEGLALAGQALRLAPIGHRPCSRPRASPNRSTCPTLIGARVLLAEVHRPLELRGERGAVRAQRDRGCRT